MLLLAYSPYAGVLHNQRVTSNEPQHPQQSISHLTGSYELTVAPSNELGSQTQGSKTKWQASPNLSLVKKHTGAHAFTKYRALAMAADVWLITIAPVALPKAKALPTSQKVGPEQLNGTAKHRVPYV